MRFENSVSEAAESGWGDAVPKELQALAKQVKEGKDTTQEGDVKQVEAKEDYEHRPKTANAKNPEAKDEETWPPPPLGEEAFYIPSVDDLAESDEEWFVCPLCVMDRVKKVLKEKSKRGKCKASHPTGTLSSLLRPLVPRH